MYEQAWLGSHSDAAVGEAGSSTQWLQQSPRQVPCQQSPYEAELRTILEQCRQLEQTAAARLLDVQQGFEEEMRLQHSRHLNELACRDHRAAALQTQLQECQTQLAQLCSSKVHDIDQLLAEQTETHSSVLEQQGYKQQEELARLRKLHSAELELIRSQQQQELHSSEQQFRAQLAATEQRLAATELRAADEVRRVAAIEGAEREAMMTDLLVVQEEASTQLAYERQQADESNNRGEQQVHQLHAALQSKDALICTLETRLEQLELAINNKALKQQQHTEAITEALATKEQKWRHALADATSAHNTEKNSLQFQLSEQSHKLQEIGAAVGQLQRKHTTSNAAAKKEAEALNLKLVDEMRMQQKHAARSGALEQEMKSTRRENEVLLNEVQLLESEESRLRKENKTLKDEVSKLDQLVYGQRGAVKKKSKPKQHR